MPEPPEGSSTAWIDVTAGVAGDMLLGALIDAGADLAAIRAAIAAVLADSVRLDVREVRRAGLRALKADVVRAQPPPDHRDWAVIRAELIAAELPERVRAYALAVFTALAEAEGAVHGIPADDVHFHEVGSLDSIADVVGCAAALLDLGVHELRASRIGLGSGSVRTEHGTLPVPTPAVLRLAGGWPVAGGHPAGVGAPVGDVSDLGELATPTGVALVTTLAGFAPALPAMRISSVGVGAGTRDPAGRPNIVRVLLGTPTGRPDQPGQPAEVADMESQLVVEANVDDIDPRLWPTVLADLLAAGAADAWLTPILMKKGRPAHTLHVLAAPELLPTVQSLVLSRTPSIGLRVARVGKLALPRSWFDVPVAGRTVRVKVAHRDGTIMQATAEFDDVAALAVSLDRPVAEILAAAEAAAVTAGLVPGRPLPA